MRGRSPRFTTGLRGSRFAVCVRDVDYAAARPFWHPDIVVFGTYQELVRGLKAWTETQWDNVWPKTEGFAFNLENTAILASADGGMVTAIAPWNSTGFHADGTPFARQGHNNTGAPARRALARRAFAYVAAARCAAGKSWQDEVALDRGVARIPNRHATARETFGKIFPTRPYSSRALPRYATPPACGSRPGSACRRMRCTAYD